MYFCVNLRIILPNSTKMPAGMFFLELSWFHINLGGNAILTILSLLTRWRTHVLLCSHLRFSQQCFIVFSMWVLHFFCHIYPKYLIYFMHLPRIIEVTIFLLAFGYSSYCSFSKIISKDVDLFLSPASTLWMVCSLWTCPTGWTFEWSPVVCYDRRCNGEQPCAYVILYFPLEFTECH